MIETTLVKAQIRRISGMDGFPRDTVAIDELVAALSSAYDTDEAIGIISNIATEATAGSKCPLQGDLRSMIRARAAQRKRAADSIVPGAPNCLRCDDSGLTGGTGVEEGKRWAFCVCAFGIQRRKTNPTAVDERNVVLDRLSKITERSEKYTKDFKLTDADRRASRNLGLPERPE